MSSTCPLAHIERRVHSPEVEDFPRLGYFSGTQFVLDVSIEGYFSKVNTINCKLINSWFESKAACNRVVGEIKRFFTLDHFSQVHFTVPWLNGLGSGLQHR